MLITYYTLESVDSTNSWAKRRAHNFASDEFAVISTDDQTQGKGRLQRNWISPKGKNVIVSFAFFTKNPEISPFVYSQIATLAVYEVIASLGILPTIKWPNDILIDGKKISGILTEVQSVNDKMLIIVGAGINVNMDKNDIDTLGRPATSISIEKNSPVSVPDVKAAYQTSFIAKLQELYEGKFEELYLRWHEKISWMKGKSIRVQQGERVLEGIIENIKKDGSLLLTTADGTVTQIYSGDII